MLSTKKHKIGDLNGVSYHFQNKYVTLPHRKHDKFTEHITIVQKGKIKVYSHNWEMVAKTGDILVFKPDEPHEIMSLEHDTKIMNILKYYDGKFTYKDSEASIDLLSRERMVDVFPTESEQST